MPIQDQTDTIRISGGLDHPNQVEYFLRSCARVIDQRGFSDVKVYISDLTRVFPDASVPIAAAVDHYQRAGVSFQLEPALRPHTRLTCFRPFHHCETPAGESIPPLSRVWMFDKDCAVQLADAILNAALPAIPFAKGAFDAFSWSIWEVMDNVLQHSGLDHGFVEAQVHPTTQRLAICVADQGVGVYTSLRDSRHRPRTERDALTLAVRERVTRDESIGQGNGLWGLYRLVSLHNGRLRITSGKSSLDVLGGEISTESGITSLGAQSPGTTVDFQLTTSEEVDVVAALGHTPVNTIIEAFQTGRDDATVVVRDVVGGTGTRISGAELRNLITNLLANDIGTVSVDFRGTPMISSSFADEAIGKLAADMGFVRFNNVILIRDANPTVAALIDRAVSSRLANAFLGLRPPDRD